MVTRDETPAACTCPTVPGVYGKSHYPGCPASDWDARREGEVAGLRQQPKYHEDMANEACQRLDARVRELLAANTAEVERRRELQAELGRMQDLIKHLCLAIASK